MPSDIPSPTSPLLQDPVCGMQLRDKRFHTTYKNSPYYFCSKGCLQRFTDEPKQYTTLFPIMLRTLQRRWKRLIRTLRTQGILPAPAPATTAGSQYSCPMHPEIITNKPDSCPECGMALEPILSAGAQGIASDAAALFSLHRLKWRFIIALCFTMPVVLIEMTPTLIRPLGLSQLTLKLLSLTAATIVIWGTGTFIFTRAWVALKRKTLNMFSLIALGTFAAYGYSLWLLMLSYIAPALIPSSALSANGTVGLYFETAAVIITLVILGQFLEERARMRTGDALRQLMELSPQQALRLQKYVPPPLTQTAAALELNTLNMETVVLAEVAVGDFLLVQPGSKIPTDGTVVAGLSEVSEALLTGEAAPILKQAGNPVIGGSVNGSGAFIMCTTRVGANTLLSELMTLTARAQRSRPPLQDITERVSKIFIPSVLVIAAFSFVIWWGWGPAPALGNALLVAVSVLIVACPCALGLAIPLALTVGIGRGAKSGMLIQNVEVLERFNAVSLVAIDKTGTLTEGKPKLTEQTLQNDGYTKERALSLLASLEALSEHPLAQGIIAAARQAQLSLFPVKDFKATPGVGISGTIEGQCYYAGSNAMAAQLGIDLPATEAAVSGTQLFLATNRQIISTFTLNDVLRPSAAATVRALRKRGIAVWLLSGDHKAACTAVQTQINKLTGDHWGLSGIYSQLSPQAKLDQLEAFKRAGHTVLMAGDGVNDAPALAAADVSIAMGTGSGVALATAHATLLSGNLHTLLSLFTLSKQTVANIKSNLFLAFVYNAVGVPLAAGILYPVTGLLLSPMLAAALMSVSSLSVIGNALRYRKLSTAVPAA